MAKRNAKDKGKANHDTIEDMLAKLEAELDVESKK